MTGAEIATLWAKLRIYWQRSRPLTDAEVVALAADDLGTIDLNTAMEVIRRRSSRGDTWPPEVGQIVADARAIANPDTSWPAALALVRQAASRFGPQDGARAVAWLTEQDPRVGSWAAEHGWWPIAMAEIDSTTYGARVQAQLATAFQAHRPADNVVSINTGRTPRQIGRG